MLKIAIVIGLKLLEIFAFCMIFVIPYLVGKLHDFHKEGNYLPERFFKGMLIIMLSVLIPLFIFVLVALICYGMHEWIVNNCQLADKIITHIKR